MKRLPVIKQLTATGCGAACLAMMAKSLGIKLSYAEAAEVCSPGRDGVNALTILKGAQQLGMRGRGLRVEVDSFTALELPVILHWGFNHFVVLEKWNGTNGTIVDPNHERRRVDWEEVDSRFAGVCMQK